jgi:MoxR-like ATPase
MEMNKVIVGQYGWTIIDWIIRARTYFAWRLGLAKTLAINTLSQAIHGSLAEFTPDCLQML